MNALTFTALCFLAATGGMLTLFAVLAVDADTDVVALARGEAAIQVWRELVAAPAVDAMAYACRASRDEWPRRVTPTDLAVILPWRTELTPGMGWVTSEYAHGRIPMPWPELRDRLRRERALLTATAEFRAIVARELFDVARAQIEPLEVHP